MNREGRLAAAITAVLLMAVAGVAAGFGWLLVATPAQWEFTEGGLVLTEAAAGRQFGIVGWFVVVGLVVSLLFGWFLERRRPRDGWFLVPVVVVGCLVAALICSRVGLAFGPPDPQTVRGLEPGDQVPMRFELSAFSPLLMWVVGGLIGLGAATYLRSPEVTERSGP